MDPAQFAAGARLSRLSVLLYPSACCSPVPFHPTARLESPTLDLLDKSSIRILEDQIDSGKFGKENGRLSPESKTGNPKIVNVEIFFLFVSPNILFCRLFARCLV